MNDTLPVEHPAPRGWGFRDAITIAAPSVERHPSCDAILDALRKHGPMRASVLVRAANITEGRMRNALPQLIDAEEIVAVWTLGVGKGRAHWVYQLPVLA